MNEPCDCDGFRRRLRHNGAPVLAAIVPFVGVVSALGGQDAPGSRNYPSFASLITLGRPQVSIGTEDKEGPTLFGEISGVALDGDMNIYVLDRTNHVVRSFSRTGRFLASAGRAGRGPADLGWPSSLVHDGRSTLYVFDRVNGIVVFDAKSGVMTHRRSFGADYQPTNACVLGDSLIIAGWRNRKILHVIGPAGEHVRSFGEGFNTDTSAAIREMASRMPIRIRCDAERGRIYVTPNGAGIVRAYHLDGRLLWQAELPAYDGHQLMMTAQGATVFYGRFESTSLLLMGKELLVIPVRRIERVNSSQVNQFGGRGSIEDRDPITYVLSAHTGQLMTRAAGAPLLGAIKEDVVVGYEQTPFPRLFVMPWREARR